MAVERNELNDAQLAQLREFQRGGRKPKQLKQNELNSLIEAARFFGNTRNAGYTDDAAIVELARQLVRVDDRRVRGNRQLRDQRQAQADALLRKEGLAMDTADLKGEGQILREDNENMGYADYAEYEAAQREGKAALLLDENLLDARERFEKAKNWLAAKPKNPKAQKNFAIKKEKLERAEAAARDYAYGMGVYAAEGEDPRPGALEDQMLRERQRRARRGEKSGVVQGGRFYEDAEDAAVPIPGARRPAVGEGFTPEDRAAAERRSKLNELIEGRAALAEESRMFRNDLSDEEMENRARIDAGRMAPQRELIRLQGPPQQIEIEGYGGGLDVRKDKTKQLIYPLVEGEAVIYPLMRGGDVLASPDVGVPDGVERGDRLDGVRARLRQAQKAPMSPANKELIARLEKQIEQGGFDFDNPYGQKEFVEFAEPGPVDYYREGAGKGDEFDIRPQKEVRRRPVGNELTPEEIGQGLMAEMRRRRDANRAGAIDRIMAGHDLQAKADAANAFHNPERYFPEGGNARAQRIVENLPNIAVLGQIKGDKLKRDMGLQLGNQRVSFPEAVRYQREDGSYEYFDANDVVLGDLSYNDRPLPGQAGNTASETLNAPIMGETAESFVERNIYDNYGAQNFGDEGIIDSLGDRGSGGGIPQVSITGELNELDILVARKLGKPVRKIRSISNLQSAANEIIADAALNNRVMFNMVDGKKVKAENPGLQEVMWDLKIAPAQQQAIANALFQIEAAKAQNVDLDAKARFSEGGVFRNPQEQRGDSEEFYIDGNGDVRPNPRFNPKMIVGVDDPMRGGNRLNLQKPDRVFGPALRAAGAMGAGRMVSTMGGGEVNVPVSPDAAKPFLGQEAGAPRRIQGNRQVWRGYDPVQVRLFEENRAIANRNKKRPKGEKAAKRQDIATPELAAKIREMQMGNIMASFEARKAEAQRNAMDRNDRGKVLPGRPVPPALQGEFVERQGQPLRGEPGARLKAPPVRRNMREEYEPGTDAVKPGAGDLPKKEAAKRFFANRDRKAQRKPAGVNENPNVVEVDAKLPASMESEVERQSRDGSSVFRAQMARNEIKRRADREQLRNRAAIGGAGLAGLAGILGLANINREEEEEQY